MCTRSTHTKYSVLLATYTSTTSIDTAAAQWGPDTLVGAAAAPHRGTMPGATTHICVRHDASHYRAQAHITYTHTWLTCVPPFGGPRECSSTAVVAGGGRPLIKFKLTALVRLHRNYKSAQRCASVLCIYYAHAISKYERQLLYAKRPIWGVWECIHYLEKLCCVLMCTLCP